MLHGVRHQFLGGHIDDIVLPLDDARQLQVDTVLDDLGQLIAVQAVGFFVHQPLQFLRRILQFWRKQPLRQGRDHIAHFGNVIGVVDDHLPAVLCT